MDAFLHLLKYEFGFLSKHKVAKWSVNGKADSTIVDKGVRHLRVNIGVLALLVVEGSLMLDL
jgi:hypothetical protein